MLVVFLVFTAFCLCIFSIAKTWACFLIRKSLEDLRDRKKWWIKVLEKEKYCILVVCESIRLNNSLAHPSTRKETNKHEEKSILFVWALRSELEHGVDWLWFVSCYALDFQMMKVLGLWLKHVNKQGLLRTVLRGIW